MPRQARFAIFQSLLAAFRRPIRILGVGGTFDFWLANAWTRLAEYRVTLLNLTLEREYPPYLRAIVGDASRLNVDPPGRRRGVL